MNRHTVLLTFAAFLCCLLLPAFVLPPSNPPIPAPGRVFLYFDNGYEKDFGRCTDIQEQGDLLTFTSEQRRPLVFRKSGLIGWSIER